MKLNLDYVFDHTEFDLDSFRDAIYNAECDSTGCEWKDASKTKEEMRALWNKIPQSIKLESIENDMDTVVREKIYLWYIKTLNNE